MYLLRRLDGTISAVIYFLHICSTYADHFFRMFLYNYLAVCKVSEQVFIIWMYKIIILFSSSFFFLQFIETCCPVLCYIFKNLMILKFFKEFNRTKNLSEFSIDIFSVFVTSFQPMLHFDCNCSLLQLYLTATVWIGSSERGVNLFKLHWL